MKKLLSIILILILTLSLLSLASCAEQEADLPTAVFADAGWDSIQFHNAVMMFIAEEAYGMETEQISATTPITWASLLTGEINCYSELWTDNLTSYGEEVAAGKVIELGINYSDNAQGFYVPRYVIEGDPERGIEPMAPDLKTVEDLKNYADVFSDPNDPSRGRILGAISGWDVDLIMRKKYEFYGLDEMYNYVDPGSDPALAASIAGAYEKGEAIVAYYWEPTWLTGKYDLVLLEDAPFDEELYPLGQTECPSIDITICVHPDFYEAAPEFCEFMSNYKSSSALTAEALMYVQDNDADMLTTAKWFLTEHGELLDQWLPAEKAELVCAALAN